MGSNTEGTFMVAELRQKRHRDTNPNQAGEHARTHTVFECRHEGVLNVLDEVQDLSDRAVHVALTLGSFMNNKSRQAWPTIETLMAAMRMKRRSLDRALDELRD